MYEADRHVRCTEKAWDPELAREIIDKTFDDTESLFKRRYWQRPNDEHSAPTTMYEGALGVLWSLDYLRHALDRKVGFDIAEMALEIYGDFDRFETRYLEDTGVENFTASYFLGRSGALTILQKLDPYRYSNYQAELIELARSNIANPTLEILWGGSGTILPILNNLERSPNDRTLNELFIHQFEFLREQLETAEDFDCQIWTQDLYGTKPRLTGAGHGFVGNVYPFLRGNEYLPVEQRQWLIEMATDTLIKTATVEGDRANWQSNLDGVDRGRPKFLVQWCHGAPGVIMAANDIHVGYSDQLDDLFLKAGEAIWQAGPLDKGLGLCHGTDGNGYALLKLYERCGDPMWLDRARAFAMHGIDQYKAQPGVWQGDSSLPLFLSACEVGRAHVPLWDFV